MALIDFKSLAEISDCDEEIRIDSKPLNFGTEFSNKMRDSQGETGEPVEIKSNSNV